MQPGKLPFLAVYMITYNHERYIAQAIESVMMQQTNFNYKLFIGDDCSTDQTREICRSLKNQYPDKIELVLRDNNIGATHNAREIYERCFTSGAKYIAMLEGDDYWIDADKLQKQVDFLEQSEGFTLSHTDVVTIDGKGNLVRNHGLKVHNYQHQKFDYRYAIFQPIAFTCTAVFKNVLSTKSMSQKIVAGDWMLWVLLTLKGDAGFLDAKTAVYRLGFGVSETTVWSKDYHYRSLFLLRLLSFRYSAVKNLWILKGALYFYMLQLSAAWNIYTLRRMAKLLRYQP